MPVNNHVQEIYDEIIYRLRFPPREEAKEIKLAIGDGQPAQRRKARKAVEQLYCQRVEEVLDEFVAKILQSATGLGLNGVQQVREMVGEVHQRAFNLAKGALSQEFRDQGTHAIVTLGMLEGRRDPVREQLFRKVNIGWRERNHNQAGAVEKEREQKFRILFSPGQAKTDFETFVAEAKKLTNPVAVLFLDIDHFKALNTRWTVTTVDDTILPEAQRLLAKLVQSRGEAYRLGGEEFLLIMPNLDAGEAKAFAEKVRHTFERHSFSIRGETQKITLSIGVALWPENGATYDEVVQAANHAEAKAKQTRNTVKLAGEQ